MACDKLRPKEEEEEENAEETDEDEDAQRDKDSDRHSPQKDQVSLATSSLFSLCCRKS